MNVEGQPVWQGPPGGGHLILGGVGENPAFLDRVRVPSGIEQETSEAGQPGVTHAHVFIEVFPDPGAFPGRGDPRKSDFMPEEEWAPGKDGSTILCTVWELRMRLSLGCREAPAHEGEGLLQAALPYLPPFLRPLHPGTLHRARGRAGGSTPWALSGRSCVQGGRSSRSWFCEPCEMMSGSVWGWGPTSGSSGDGVSRQAALGTTMCPALWSQLPRGDSHCLWQN